MSFREFLLYAAFLLVPFAVQLVILFLTENRLRPLRFAVPVFVGAAGVISLLACVLTAPKGWGPLLLPLVVVICLALGSLSLAGWGLAWLIYRVSRKTAD